MSTTYVTRPQPYLGRRRRPSRLAARAGLAVLVTVWILGFSGGIVGVVL